MCKPITEKDISHSDIIAAPINNVRRWYRQLQFIVDNEAVNYDVKITFMTQSGNRVVNTHIVAVIENYVKINEGIIIPLNSITDIYSKDTVVTISSDDGHIGITVLIILVILTCAVVIYFIVK